ncbi:MULTISPECIES: HAD family hydrolase [unclassified Streptomyces]|uniref:HAD family hydrolase n=1 Tax=unclassified Streptomyces TaxID=2593676 RepID=UPI0036F5AC3D
MPPRRAAFFDVDETLITAKSMLDFLRHWLGTQGDDGCAFRAERTRLRALAASGVDRATLNRTYFERFAGVPHAHLLATGRAWWRGYRQRPDAFVPEVRRALDRHHAAGDSVVLVSGSCDALLEPITREVGADHVLSTRLAVDSRGLLTGEVERPMIGAAKGAGVAATMRRLGLEPDDCFAYGDHDSDLDMLALVGHPVVVGSNAVLLAHAAAHDWPVLPGTGPSAPSPVPRPLLRPRTEQQREAAMQHTTTTGRLPRTQPAAGAEPPESYWVICRHWAGPEEGSEDATDIDRVPDALSALEALTTWHRTMSESALAWVVRTSAPFPYEVPALPVGELVTAARADAGALGDAGAERLGRALKDLRA